MLVSSPRMVCQIRADKVAKEFMLSREWVATLSDKPLPTLMPADTDRPVAADGSAINDKGVDSPGYESAGFRRVNLVPGNQDVFIQVLAFVILAAHPFFEC